MTKRILVTIEGGVVQNISTDEPADVIMIDFDTEGAIDPTEVYHYQNTEAYIHESQATVDSESIDRTLSDIEEAKRLKEEENAPKPPKVVVFQYRAGMGEHNVTREEVEFSHDASEEEISKEFQSWVWEQVIGDHVTWYEKEDE